MEEEEKEMEPLNNEDIKKISKGCGALVGIVLFVALKVLVLMLVWNWLMPDIFDLPKINFIQSFGLALLSYTLFGFKNTITKNDE